MTRTPTRGAAVRQRTPVVAGRWRQWLGDNIGVPLIVSALMLGCVAMVLVVRALSLRTIFPKDHLPISKIYVASAFDVCSQEHLGARPLAIFAMERCVAEMRDAKHADEQRWTKVHIWTPVEIMDHSHVLLGGAQQVFRLQVRQADQALGRQGEERLEWKLYEAAQPAVVRVEVPPAKYAADTLSKDYQVLGFAQMLNGVVCVAGRCATRATESQYGRNLTPLVVREGQEPPGPVYLWADVPNRPYVLNLELGVWVAANADTGVLDRFLPLYQQADTFLPILILGGLLLTTAALAWAQRRYRDPGAFILFVTSLLLVPIAENPMFLAAGEALIVTSRIVALVAWSNATLMGLGFVCAIARWRWLRLTYWALAFCLIMILAAAAWGVASMLAAENQYHFRMNIDRARIVGWLVLACGSLILCSLRLWQLYRQLPKYRRSDRVVRQRRLSQLSVILIGFGIFALPLLVNAYALAVKGLMQVQSLPPLCLLGVAVAGMAVFFPSFEQVASAQTAAFPQAEAERLALTLSRRDLEAWAAVERRTVSCELDLRGATALTIYLGTDLQTLMDLLRERATADFAQYGEVLLDRKPMGDAVIIIMEVAGDASLAEATRKMVALLRARLPVYWSLVQDVYRALATASALAELPPAEIYVHAKVLAVSSMSFAVPNGRRDDPRLDTILSRYDLSSWRKQASSSRDFTAAEINHYLKFVGKAQKGHITLCMPRAEVEDLDQLDNLRSLSDLVDAYLRAEKGLEPAAIAQDPMVRYLASKDLVTATVPLSPQAKIKKPPRGAA